MQRRMVGVVLLCAAVLVSGCYGPFTLTRKVHHWNGQVSDNKWVVEGVFLLCACLPVYSIASMADAVIFNSVEFWTGKSMLAERGADGSGNVRRIVRADAKAVLTRIRGPEGEELLIEQSYRGQVLPSVRIRRQGEAMVALGPDGTVLFTARTVPDGHLVVTDAHGRQQAAYSEEDVRQYLAAAVRR